MKMWICRATNGVLTLHQFKPRKIRMDDESKDFFWTSDVCQSFLNRQLFPEVTFENSPHEVELKLIEK